MSKHLIRRISAAAAAVMLSASFMSVSGGISTADYKDEIAALEERRTALSSQREELESKLKEYLDGAETQDKYLKLYDEKMAVQEEEMNNLTEQINLICGRIDSLDIQISEKQKEVDKGIEEFKERLRAMYMSGNDGVADVLTGSSSFYDILARLEMVQRISEHDNEMISELCYKIEELDSDKTALETERAELDVKKEEQISVLASLRETYANHEETKKWYEEQAKAFSAQTEDLKAEEAAAEEELQKYIREQQAEIAKKMEAKRKKEREEAAARKAEKEAEEAAKKAEEAKTAAETETELQTEPFTETTSETAVSAEYDLYTPSPYSFETTADFSVYTETVTRADDPYFTYEWGKTYYPDEGDGTESAPENDAEYSEGSEKGYGSSSHTGFIWPVPSVRNMTDGYGNRYINEESSNDFHKGIDINKPGCAGEPIVASAGGVVITASNTGNGYGIHVVIDHGDSISTLYGHMSSTAVSVGDEVTQGQVIGYIGNTGYAYGYHCHFEVRVNGQHTDPSEYVSMDN